MKKKRNKTNIMASRLKKVNVDFVFTFELFAVLKTIILLPLLFINFNWNFSVQSIHSGFKEQQAKIIFNLETYFDQR